MNKHLYTLALTPIIFMACANTEPKQTETAQEIAIKKVAIKKTAPISNPIETQASVSFIENKKVLEKGMLHINTFMGSMQPTLKGLLKEDKTHITAMGACSSMALDMINDYNRQITGVKLRRTALKYRNPKNKPDKADRIVMDTFVSTKKFKPLVVDLGNQYRVYKPLVVKQSCLLCHGARNDINPKIVKMIDRRYPKDRATGFELGEFRGVVVADMKK
ncbi:Cytochrome c family protein [hydrothermal vent metagenome]|uniref:Cytochrome c family protein n=1 Tax=hydrothermal vent metagenome TaxID=652676 RepID=A0A1W1D1H2_9ZZZZ